MREGESLCVVCGVRGYSFGMEQWHVGDVHVYTRIYRTSHSEGVEKLCLCGSIGGFLSHTLRLGTGACVRLSGKIGHSPLADQQVEMQVDHLEVLGYCEQVFPVRHLTLSFHCLAPLSCVQVQVHVRVNICMYVWCVGVSIHMHGCFCVCAHVCVCVRVIMRVFCSTCDSNAEGPLFECDTTAVPFAKEKTLGRACAQRATPSCSHKHFWCCLPCAQQSGYVGA